MPPTIPNYEDQSHAIVKAGMTFAIEPFATNGKGLIYEEGKAMIFSQISQKSASSLLATNLLKQIKTFQGLPFAMHDLVSKEMPLQDVDKGLSELLKTGIIAGYAPLVEEAHGMVAQAENSILVDEKGQVLVTTRL